jgi:hypothetical protein
MNERAVVKKAMIRRADQVLRPRGFMRKKARWYRKVSDFLEVIDFQISKEGDAITINAVFSTGKPM